LGDRYFRTFRGKRVHAFAPCPEEIDIDDLAHSLAHQCRFLGHTDSFYSVAQHSVVVSRLVPRPDALWGLLHDASEAYLGDLPEPVKCNPLMAVYREAEDRLLACICGRFGLAPEIPASINLADRIALATEFRDVTTVNDPAWVVEECGVAPCPTMYIIPWAAAVAEDQFLRRYWELAK
jgi:uncharacterized protein